MSYLDHLFAIPVFRNARPCMIYRCYMGILIGGMLCKGVMVNNWQCRDETEGLLWAIATWLCYLARAGIVVASHDPLCNYAGVTLLWVFSKSIPRCSIWKFYISDINLVSLTFEIAKRIIFEGTDLKLNKLSVGQNRWKCYVLKRPLYSLNLPLSP